VLRYAPGPLCLGRQARWRPQQGRRVIRGRAADPPHHQSNLPNTSSLYAALPAAPEHPSHSPAHAARLLLAPTHRHTHTHTHSALPPGCAARSQNAGCSAGAPRKTSRTALSTARTKRRQDSHVDAAPTRCKTPALSGHYAFVAKEEGRGKVEERQGEKGASLPSEQAWPSQRMSAFSSPWGAWLPATAQLQAAAYVALPLSI
jgi:hypothetical protein